MSITTNIGLFKHDNPATNTDEFNVDKALNQNWDKIDEAIGEDRERILTLENDNTTNKQDITEIKAKDTEQDKYIAELEAENTRLREDLNGLPTRQASGESIDLSDSAEMRCDLKISGNSKQETRILPDEYTQVDYIESTGTQYIDTGYIPQDTDNIYLKFYPINNETFMGSDNFVTARGDSYTNDYWKIFETNAISVGGQVLETWQEYNYNGETKEFSDGVHTITGGNVACTKNLYLFRRFGYNYGGKARISRFIVENKINMIPCYRNSDNEIGLYDTVNNVFYTNQGSGTFLKGNDSSLPNSDYPSEVESCGDNINIFDINVASTWQGDNTTYSVKNNMLNVKGYYFIGIEVPVKKNTDYYLSAIREIVISKNYSGAIAVYSTDKNTEIHSRDFENFAFNSGNNNSVYVLFYAGLNQNGECNFSNIKIEDSPYGQGCINEVICNKNIFESTFKWYSVGSNGELEQRQGCHSEFIKIMPNKDYTIFNEVGVYGAYYLVSYYDKDKKWIKNSNTYWYDNKISFNASDVTEYIRVSYLYISPDSVNETFKIQLNVGENALPYIEHKSQTYTIPTQQPMRSIGDVRDTFVKIGNKWFERHYIERLILDGTEIWEKSNTALNGFWCTDYRDVIIDKNALCNIAKYTSDIEEYKNKYSYFCTKDCDININVPPDVCGDNVTSWKAYLSEQNVNGTPVYVDCILAKLLDIECTEEQNKILDQIEKEVKTYKNVTHMYSTDKISSYKDVTYKKDLETRLNNIEQAILSQGGNI